MQNLRRSPPFLVSNSVSVSMLARPPPPPPPPPPIVAPIAPSSSARRCRSTLQFCASAALFIQLL